MSYMRIHNLRANRHGTDYVSRLQGKRESNFEHFLQSSVSRVDFEYREKIHPAIFERKKQDYTENLRELLTRRSLEIDPGTILMIPDHKKEIRPFLVYWVEDIQNSGYNKYIMLEITHYLEWIDSRNIPRNSWAYMYGQKDRMLRNAKQFASRMDTYYSENEKLNFFVIPRTPHLQKEDYLEVGKGPYKEFYKVVGYDRQSTPGVQFVSILPMYEYDKSPLPDKEQDDLDEDFFWLKGGKNE